jgi:hypothetical protein
MTRTRNRRRLALLGILALALSVTAGLAVADTAAAKHKKKNKNPGGTVDITMPVNARVPDATVTGSTLKNGILTSTIDVPAARPFIGTLIRDVNVTVQTTGNTPSSSTSSGSASQLDFRLTAPNGTTSWLFGDEAGSPVSGASIGPLTLDDETPVQLTPAQNPADDTQLGPPYNGTAQPDPFTSLGPAALWIMDGGPATGTWTLRVYDIVPPFDPDPAITSVLNSWRITVVAGKPFRVVK